MNKLFKEEMILKMKEKLIKWKFKKSSLNALIFTLVSFALVLTLTLVWNARRAYADTVLVSYDGVDYLTEDLIITWDISEIKGEGKILAYYFRDEDDDEKYGGGTVVIKDVNPSLDPNNPNRLMWFKRVATYYFGVVGYLENGQYIINEFWEDFDKQRRFYQDGQTQLSGDWITTPWSNMSEYSKKNGTDNIVHRLVIANEVHTGDNLNALFGGCTECKYFDLRNLKVDYEYMKVKTDGERTHLLFQSDDDCVIKMFDNSGYLPRAFESNMGIGAYNITLDYSDVDMDFSAANDLTYTVSTNKGGNHINKIILPKTLKNLSEKVPFWHMLYTYQESTDGYFFSVHKANGDVIGYTDHMIAQDDPYDEFDGIPSYIEKEEGLLPYYAYMLYTNTDATSTDKSRAMSLMDDYLYYNGTSFNNTNMGIDLESFCGKTNCDTFSEEFYTYANSNVFYEDFFNYIKERLEEELGTGNFMLPTNIEADFNYNKQNDTNKNPYHIVYLAMNEFFKKIFNPEIEITGEKEIYTYLDEITVKVKNTLNLIFERGFNFIFGKMTSKDVYYYDEFEHDGIIYDETTIADMEQYSVPIVTSNDDYYTLSYTINTASEHFDDYLYFEDYIFLNKDANVHIKLTLNKPVRDDLDLSFKHDSWYSSKSSLYITSDMFTGNECEFDLMCDEDEPGCYSLCFGLKEHNLESDESLTIEVNLPKRYMELEEKEFETVPDVANILSICETTPTVTYYNELTDYYVIKVHKDHYYSSFYTQYDGSIDHGYFYYTGGKVGAYQASNLIDPDWYPEVSDSLKITDPSTITDATIDDLIDSGAILRADTNLCDAAICFNTYDYDNAIFIFPKQIPYNKIKGGNEFKLNFTKTGEYSSSLFFKGFKDYYKAGRLYTDYKVNPLALTDSSISIKTNDGSDHDGIFGLHINKTDGATYNSIKLYRTNNVGRKVEIPSTDYEISYSSNKGEAGTKGTLTITGKSSNVTGSKTFEFDLYEKDDNHNGIDDNFENRSSGGGGGGSSKKPSTVIQPEEEKVVYDEFVSFINGYDDGEFKPNRPMTRAEFAKIIASINDDFEENSNKYTSFVKDYNDVRDDYWNTPYIGYVLSKNIMNGYPDGSFRPEGKITRAEVCIVLTRLFELTGTGKENIFKDEIKNKWYEPEVTKVINAGLIKGYEDGTFGANRNITRAELVALMNRVLDKNYDEEKLKEFEEKFESVYKDIKKTDWYYQDIVRASASEKQASILDIILTPIKVAEGIIKNIIK